MKKYLIILVISIFLFVIFLTIYVTYEKDETKPNDDNIIALTTSKSKIKRVIDVINSNLSIFDLLPNNDIANATKQILESLNNFIIEVKNLDESIIDVSILDLNNDIISSVPGLYDFSVFSNNDLEISKNKFYEISVVHNNLILVRKIITSDKEFVAKVVIIFDKNKLFFNNNKTDISKLNNRIKIGEDTFILYSNENKADILEINRKNKEKLQNLNISKDKTLFCWVNKTYTLYITNIEDVFFIGFLKKFVSEETRDNFFLIVLASGIIVLLSFILIVFNLYIKNKSDKLDWFNSEINQEIDRCA